MYVLEKLAVADGSENNGGENNKNDSKLFRYDFKIQYWLSYENKVADLLSRKS